MSQDGGGSGCLKWFLIGVGAVVLLILISIFGGYYVLMHTAWPVRKVVDAMTEGSDVEIEGIEGSLSSGFTVEKIRYPDEQGNITEIDDIGFKYAQEGDAFVITDMYVTRAHIYVDGFNEVFSEDDDVDVKVRNNQFNQSKPLNLIVKEIDISDVTIEDTQTGEKIIIDKIFLDGFECINNDVKLGTLTLKSNHCNIEIKPIDSSSDLAKEHVIKGIVKKSIHKAIIKDITLSGKFVSETTESYKLDLQLFDGKIKIKKEEPDDISFVSTEGFTPNEYISTIFCLNDINFKFSGTGEKGNAEVANFKIGSKLFEVDKSLFKDTQEKDLVAECKDGKITYQCTIQGQGKSLPKVKLSSVPKMTEKDILGMLLFDSKYSKLKASQKSQIDNELKLAK